MLQHYNNNSINILDPLDQYTGVLNQRLAKHLLRRSCFQYSKTLLDEMTGKTPQEVMAVLDAPKSFAWDWPNDPVTIGPNANNCPGIQDGYWINKAAWTNATYPCRQGPKRGIVTGWWWYNTLKQNTLIDKLTWFLFTTFTVSKDDGAGRAAHFFDYLNLIRFFSDKSIKDLARKISFDNSMLYYLDNGQNNKNSPNENYAREFLELFTIGKGTQVAEGDYTNYTEHDVVQAARVFSGIKNKRDRNIYDADTAQLPHYPNGIPMGYINVNQHDTGNKTFSHAFDAKTISGGNTTTSIHDELDDFVDMIFNRLETAKNYVRKLYRMYVRSEWDQTIEDTVITPLAQQLLDNDYNIKEVLITLLTSKHFFDLDDSDSTNENIGGIIKSPLQFFNELISILDIRIPNPNTPQIAQGASQAYKNENYRFYLFWWSFSHQNYFPFSGMKIFAPSTVAGYPADYQAPTYDRAWFGSNNILARYNTIKSFVGSDYNDNYGNGNNQIKGANYSASGRVSYTRIWSYFNSIDFVQNNCSDPSDAAALVQELSDLLYCEAIDANRISYFTKSLINDGEVSYIWYDAWVAYANQNNTSEDAAVFVKNRLDDLFLRMINAAEFQIM